MRLQFRSIRSVLILAGLTIVAIALAVSFLLWDLRNRDLENARLQTVSIAHMFMEQTYQNFDGADLLLLGVQERLQSPYGRATALDSLPIHLLLSTRAANMRQLTSIFLVDANGVIVNTSREEPVTNISVADRGYFRAFVKGARGSLVIDKPVRNRRDGSWSMHVAREFTGSDGKFRGAVVAAMSIPRFEQLYHFMKLDYVRPLALYLDDGTLIASLPHRDTLIGDRAPELGAELALPPRDTVRIMSHVSGDGGRQTFALGYLARFPLLVSVTNEEDVALASWRETSVPIALGALLVSILIALVAARLARELVREGELADALREANERYHQTLDSVMDAIVAVDAAQNIRLFNPAAERMFGLPAAQVIGQPLAQLLPDLHRDQHVGHVDRFMRSGGNSRAMGGGMEITGLRADGIEFPIESTISQTLVDGQPQLTAVLRDVSERRRAEVAQREMNRQLRELSASLQEVREQERTRIARELHDDLGQQLTGLKLDLSWFGNRVKEGRPPSADKVDEMRHMLDAAISSVRRISTELRPPILDDSGFGEAVAWQAGEFARRSGLEVTLDLQAADQVQNKALATALFRIVQESFTNIVRHAQARQVAVRLRIEDGQLLLRIHDDGQGIQASPLKRRGVGLVSMQERAMAFGGQLDVSSEPGSGTTIEVRLPLAALATAEEGA